MSETFLPGQVIRCIRPNNVLSEGGLYTFVNYPRIGRVAVRELEGYSFFAERFELAITENPKTSQVPETAIFLDGLYDVQLSEILPVASWQQELPINVASYRTDASTGLVGLSFGVGKLNGISVDQAEDLIVVLQYHILRAKTLDTNSNI